MGEESGRDTARAGTDMTGGTANTHATTITVAMLTAAPALLAPIMVGTSERGIVILKRGRRPFRGGTMLDRADPRP
jgi:hypothetical protein